MNMEWLVDKIDRKLRMFLKTKDTAYLKKAFSLMVDLLNEYDLYLAWKRLDEEKREGVNDGR